MMTRRGQTRASVRRVLRSLTGIVMLALVASLLPAAARAEPYTLPPVLQRNSRSVTADALPTAQVNGVVLASAISGNTVYAAGQFTAARPAGAAPGTQELPRSNLLAFDITTGVLTSFAPSVNGQVREVQVSPDGKRLYIAGNFTAVGAAARNYIASFDLPSGTLNGFAPSPNAVVNAIALTNSTVYFGGSFSQVNGVTRSRLAAATVGNGSLTAWAPSPDGTVQAMTATPDQKKIIVGGSFYTLNVTVARGMAALDATTGARTRWKINSTVRDYGTKSAILSLTADGDTIYGSGYAYGGGNFEGAFAASPTDGTVQWLQDCHGDTYDVVPIGDIVYSVGHPHFCSNIGGFPDPEPRMYHYTLAATKKANGIVATNGQLGAHYGNFAGQPAPSLYNWFPTLTPGTFTGQSQAAWTVTGNSTYLVLGGEFPSVNGVAQQGLVRLAISSVAPKSLGPSGAQSMQPVVTASSLADAAVSWTTAWDPDDTTLHYEVLRDGVVVYTTKYKSTFWNRPPLTYSDLGLRADTDYSYQIRVTDGDGNSALGPSTTFHTLPVTR